MKEAARRCAITRARRPTPGKHLVRTPGGLAYSQAVGRLSPPEIASKIAVLGGVWRVLLGPIFSELLPVCRPQDISVALIDGRACHACIMTEPDLAWCQKSPLAISSDS